MYMVPVIRPIDQNLGNKYKNKPECSRIPLAASENLSKLLQLIKHNNFKAPWKYFKIGLMRINTINISNNNKLQVQCNLNLNPSSVDCGGL